MHDLDEHKSQVVLSYCCKINKDLFFNDETIMNKKWMFMLWLHHSGQEKKVPDFSTIIIKCTYVWSNPMHERPGEEEEGGGGTMHV